MSQGQFFEIANPLGFTNEVAALITGLGCTNLKQFKNKDIGLEDLPHLTREDLALLEVGDNFDFRKFESLQNSLKKKYDKVVTATGLQDVNQILSTTRKQMEIVNYHLKYMELKLKTNRGDLFIDMNKNLKASEVMVEACHNLFTEVKEIRTHLSSLERLKAKQKSVYFPENLKGYLAVISGIFGVVGAGLFTVYKFL